MDPKKQIRKYSPTTLDTSGNLRNIVLLCLVLIVIILAIYMQTGNHQFVDLDDHAYVMNNPCCKRHYGKKGSLGMVS